MSDYVRRVTNCIPALPPGVKCPMIIGERILAVDATYVFPSVGVFPDCYEFIIIYSGFPTMVIGRKDYYPWAHSVAIINPGQPHWAKSSGICRLYNPFFIQSQLVNSIAKSIGGKGSVEFYNGIYDLPEEVLNLANLFCIEARSCSPGRELSISCLETMLVVAILRNIPNNQNLANTKFPRRGDQHSIERVKEFMHQHIQQNINLEQLAKVANYSNYHFIRFFKNATGKTPFDYLTDIKIDKAAAMLKNKGVSVTEVCYACGFTNPSHFTTVFKRKKGVTPSKYQKTEQKG